MTSTFYPAYAAPINLPASVTTGTTVQSFIDVLGDMWVAKNGVNGGNWFRARDVVTARYNLAAAWTVPTTVTKAPLTGANFDAYGLNDGAGGFVVPVPGLYKADTQLVVAGVSGYVFQVYLYADATQYAGGNSYGTVTGGLFGHAHDLFKLNAGQVISSRGACSTAAAASVGQWTCYLSVAYQGTG
jgi:hypothetical protein